MTSAAQDKRDNAVADLMIAITVLVKELTPLIIKSIKDSKR